MVDAGDQDLHRIRISGTWAEPILLELEHGPARPSTIRKNLRLERYQAFRGFAQLRKYGLIANFVATDDHALAGELALSMGMSLALHRRAVAGLKDKAKLAALGRAAVDEEPLVALTQAGRVAAAACRAGRASGERGCMRKIFTVLVRSDRSAAPALRREPGAGRSYRRPAS
jgi:hypothetical protein